MTSLERDILHDIVELLETYDASMGDVNRSEIADIKGKLQGLELLARIEEEHKKHDDGDWRKRLKALEPLLILLSVIALLIINLLGVEINPAQLLP